MFNKWIFALAVMLTLTLACVYTTHAQISDISDDYWTIIVPSASAMDVDMGQVVVHQSRDLMVTGFLTNTGSVAISIEAIVFEGADADAFSLVSGIPPFEIPRGETKAVEFRFSPSSVGMKTASLHVHTQVDTLRHRIHGEGLQSQYELLTDVVDFGDVVVGSTRDITEAIVRNNSGADIMFARVELLGPDLTQFDILSGGGEFTLAAGQTRSMELRFAPDREGPANSRLGLFQEGSDVPAEVQLRGVGTVTGAMAVLGLDTIRARAGEIIGIPVYLRDQRDLANSGATGFHAELSFNASLLAPVGETPQGSIQNNERIIVLDALPLEADSRQVLITLDFMAMLGNAESTPLMLSQLSATGGNVHVSDIPGLFILTDICREGGVRLYHELGGASLQPNRPNPFNSITIIDYTVIESGYTRLIVTDILGRPVAVLVDDVLEAGNYSTIFDASGITSGTYLCVLQTPSERIFRLMEVVK